MILLIKSEMLKIKWTKLVFLLTISFILLFLINMSMNNISFLSSGDTYDLGNNIGFISGRFNDTMNPTIEEIIRHSLAITGFYWIFILVFTTMFYMMDFNLRTINISVAFGESLGRIYTSKIVVLSIISTIMYASLVIFKFAYSCMKYNIQFSTYNILIFFKLLLLNILLLEVFIFITMFILTIVKKGSITITIMSFFTLSLPMLHMMVWDSINTISYIQKIYLIINPMYYLSRVSAYNLNENLVQNSIIYSIISIGFCFLTSLIVLKRSEIR